MNSPTDAYWMMPLMWFFQLGVFAGFAIYLPELFPSRMRSTGTSFCYNLGRFAAAVGSFFSASWRPMFLASDGARLTGTLRGHGDVRDFPDRHRRRCRSHRKPRTSRCRSESIAHANRPRSVRFADICHARRTLPLVSRAQPLPLVRADRGGAGLAVRLPRSAAVHPGPPAGDDGTCCRRRPTRPRSTPTAATPPRSF